MDLKKRFRSINWSAYEKQLFRSVIKEYAPIIENKSLDYNTNKKKTKAWEEVHKKFNELNGQSRGLNHLKIQWKAMKINARKTISTLHRESNKTGGGTRPKTPDDAVIEIKDLLNPAELLIDHNVYDSDGIIPSTSTEKVEPKTRSETCVFTVQDSKPLIITNINAENQEVADPKRKIGPNNKTGSSLKSRKDQNDHISSMISHSKMLKDKEHLRRMEMADEEHSIKMEIHKEKLKSVILEKEILELKKAREELS